MKKLTVVSSLFLFSLSACAIASETYLPDGSKGFSINCSGMVQSWNDCYQKAGELCRERGFKVVAGGTERGYIATPQSAGTVINRNMLISCK